MGEECDATGREGDLGKGRVDVNLNSINKKYDSGKVIYKKQ